MSYFVGVDGGGTRTTAVLIDDQSRELARMEGAAGIVNILEPEAGGHQLADLVTSTLARAHVDALPKVLVCALAGAGRAPERERLERSLSAHGVAEWVRIVGDFEAAVQDAFGDGSGILVVAGTGSSAFARNADGRTARAGGWGHILGDEGSGYSLGVAALRRAMREYDGREPSEGWLQLIVEQTGVASVDALVRWAAGAAKADIAALAPVVFEAAERDTESARAIVAGAARELALHIQALYERLKPWREVPTVALTGGLLAPGRPLRQDVVVEIERLNAGFPLLEQSIDAARGAAALALATAH